jgi:hypothetical protein
MFRRWLLGLSAGVLCVWAGSAQAQLVPTYQENVPPPASSQLPPLVTRPLNRFYYYPYYYFPHSYWPTQGPKWPEPVGAAYMPPPAYMAYPPFKEPGWRYDLWEPHHYYRGFHFWLDQF